jgi:hypothetical protein
VRLYPGPALRSAAAILSSFLFACFLSAQTNRGGISGTVTDSSGAVVPNAEVTIVNVGTNETHHLKTGANGAFIEENLEPAQYRLTAEAPGFKKGELINIKVDTGTVATANVVLEPGNVNTEVTVAANTSMVNTESATVGQTITGRELNDLPLPNRSVLDLLVTTPNATGDVGTEDPQVTSGVPLPGFNVNVNGGRSGSTYMIADGIGNTGVGLAREAVAFSPETVQEFTVETNSFDAQYGRTGGGIVSVTTKSGTNQFNGMLLWYMRNPLFNADPYTQATVNRPVENLRWNQFDAQIGGPVIIPKLYNGRNKTFFFFSAEPRYQSDHLQATADLPDQAMLNGDFSNLVALNGGGTSGGAGWAPASLKNQFPASAFSSNSTVIYNQFNQVGNNFTIAPLPASGTYSPFPGNKIPSTMLDPVSLKLLQYLPKANTDYFLDSNGYVDNFITYRYVSDNEVRYNLHLDQNIGDRHHLSFRWTTIPEIGIQGFDPQYPTDGAGATYSDSSQYMFGWTFTIAPTMVNELRLAYTRGNFSGSLPPQYDINTGQNLSTQYGLPSLTKGGLPLISFELDSFGAIGSQGSQLNDNLEQQYEIADNFYITHGAMSIKFGVDLSRDMLNTMNFYAADGGNYSFRYVQTDATGAGGNQGQVGGIGFASFLLGVPNQVSLANSLIPYYYRWYSGAGYVQDDWKIKPNFTLNLGLRYTLELPRTEEYNHQGFFDPALAQTVTLASPLTLPTGDVITQATEIPFAFDGYGGRSRYLTPIHWLDFEPRFGFSWQPAQSGFWNWVIRGGYGISHVPLTGNNRQPIPNFAAGTPNFGETAGQTNPNYVMRLSSNPPYDPFVPPNQILGLVNNPTGLVYGNAINFPAYVTTGETSVPYVQNWSLSLQKQLGARTLVELDYLGAKGTHLFMPAVDVNNPPSTYLEALQNLNVNATSTINDPLGRKAANGSLVKVNYASLEAPFFGFGPVSTYYDASGNSSFNAGVVSLREQMAGGFTGYANFRWSKSIDDASDASPDKNALTTSNIGGGEYSYGAPASWDRSVSTYNIPYDLNIVGIYDLPFGEGRKWGQNAWYPLRFAFGDWTVSGVERFYSGYPFTPTIATDPFINTTTTHEIRPDIVPGVPIINPLYNPSCPTTAVCQPYINTAAFMLPPAGQLGDAPRTLSMATGPMIQTLDVSVQKTWHITERTSVQFRVDALNVLNHPVFRNTPDSGGGTDIFGSYPGFSFTPAQIQSIYSSWASGQSPAAPAANTPAGKANIATIESFTIGAENSKGALPNDFYSVPLPTGVALMNPNSFNILTPMGFKQYEIRQNIDVGNGVLSYQPTLNPPRYIQFGLKIYF